MMTPFLQQLLSIFIVKNLKDRKSMFHKMEKVKIESISTEEYLNKNKALHNNPHPDTLRDDLIKSDLLVIQSV